MKTFLLSVTVLALGVLNNTQTYAYTGNSDEAAGAGNAQRWLLCLMLSEGLITQKEMENAVSLASKYNVELFGKLTKERASMIYPS